MTKIDKNISWISTVYFLLRFINPFFSPSKLMIICFTIIEALPLFWIILSRHQLKKRLILVVCLAVISICMSMLYSKSDYFSDIVYTVLGVFLGHQLSETRIKRKHASFLFCFFVIVISLRYLIVRDANLVFVTSSRNSISAFLILGSTLFYSTYNEKESLPLMPALVTLLLSCLAVGRGGILASLLLVSFIIIYNTFVAKTKRLHTFITTIISFGVLAFFYTKNYELFFKGAKEKMFSENLVQNERVSYFFDYLNYISHDFRRILFGVNAFEIPSIAYLGGNFHNSYLSVHSKSGLLGFLIVVLLIIKSTINALKNKKIIPVCMLIVVLARMLTDALCFTGIWDPLFYYLIFCCLDSCNNQNSSSV